MEYRGTRGLRGHSLSLQVDDFVRAKTYGRGRVCRVEGCETVLSAYNPSSVCSLHQEGWRDEVRRPARKQRAREELTRYCSFDPCGREFVTTNPAKKYCCDACRMRAFQARVVASRHDTYSQELTEIRRAS